MNEQKGGMPNIAVWVIALGAGASGVSGFGSMGQLQSLQSTLEEQVRQAEVRGQLQAEIRANRLSIDELQRSMANTMTNKGILRLHDSQQSLIDKLIDWTGNTVTKEELRLAIKKLKAVSAN